MSFNAEEIVQELRSEFESILVYVQESRDATADQVERDLFRQLLALGAQLLLLFFCLRAAEHPRTSLEKDGMSLPHHGAKQRSYYSIFGKVPLVRPYFYLKGVAGASPLDERLSLGDSCYSDLVREMAEFLGVDSTYEKVSKFFARLLGQSLSTQAIAQMVTDDAADVQAYYEQKPAPDVASEGAILVVQADGKGVPMVRETAVEPKARLRKGEKRTKKKEAVVTGVYTIAGNVRTPAQVAASFFGQVQGADRASGERTKPQNKHLWATLDGKDAALQRLVHQAAVREGPHIQHRVALTDGCQALQQRIESVFPNYSLVLDFVHASEYLWKAANSLFGEQAPERDPWVEQQALALLSGHTAQVIADLQTLAQQPKRTQTQRKALTTAANYFQRNLPYMHYDHYLAQGWPIASGVIEGACRHFVRDRCELSGMRWTQEGVENLLGLRAVAENGDWDPYHQFRKQQRHLRLYHSPFSERTDPEAQAFNMPASGKIIHFDQVTQKRCEPPRPIQQRLAA